MNIAQLSEQLKDVPQAKLIDYAKNPNSVVPQFLALAEIQRRQTLMRAMPGQVPQSSVAEDIMAAEAPRMSGVARLPTRAMFTEEGMAGGGIVAFADGGDAEDEYEEALSKMRRSRLQGIQEALAEAGTYLKNPLAKLEGKPTSVQRRAEEETSAPMATPSRKGSHKYEDLVLAEAQRQGLDPNLARHVLYKETGNLSNPESAKSKAGALGVMQLMPKTAKELGVDPMNPEDNIRGGVMYLRKMMDKYNDPILAAAAYNAGPGRVDKALKGQGITALPRETRMYIAGLADGGSVKAYANAGLVDEDVMYDPVTGLPISGAPSRVGEEPSITKLLQPGYKPFDPKEWEKKYGKDKKAPPVKAEEKPELKPEFTYPPQGGIGPTYGELGVGATPEATPKGPTSQSYFDALMKNIEDQAAEAKRQGDQNKYLALMQAGFGMMASQSPYAATGIGQGAMTGLGTYAGLEKGRREDERSLMAARLGLAKAKAAQEEAEATREATKEYRTNVLEQRKTEAAAREIATAKDDYRQTVAMIESNLLKKYPLGASDPKYQAELQTALSSPELLALRKQAFPSLQSMPGSGGWSIKPKQ